MKRFFLLTVFVSMPYGCLYVQKSPRVCLVLTRDKVRERSHEKSRTVGGRSTCQAGGHIIDGCPRMN